MMYTGWTWASEPISDVIFCWVLQFTSVTTEIIKPDLFTWLNHYIDTPEGHTFLYAFRHNLIYTQPQDTVLQSN